MMILSALCGLSLTFFAVYGQDKSQGECPAVQEEPWSYSGSNGPESWGSVNSACSGRQQSPIAIDSSSAIEDKNLAKLTLNGYDQPIEQGTVENNGHTVKFTPTDGKRRTISVNGDEYDLRQFHFHWGDDSHDGSEHTFDDTRYAMEMHLVHTNSDDQYAVVGLFVEEQDMDGEEFQKVVDELPNVLYKGDNSPFTPGFNLNDLFRENPTSFYRYQGSLTTPPCSEGVIWSVVPDPISAGRDQINQFFKLYSVKKEEKDENCHLVNNYRPLQPLNDRQVYRSQ